MSFRGEQKIKGITYVFEAVSKWDAQKKQSRQRRIYIGKMDPVTGAFLPNKRYYELYGTDTVGKASETEAFTKLPGDVSVVKSVDYGTLFLMRHVIEITGLSDVLKQCYPKQWQELLACAIHECSEKEPLCLCESWAETLLLPGTPSPQRIGCLLKELDEDGRMEFYRRWVQLREEKEYLVLDISSVTSWSELVQAARGREGFDDEHFPWLHMVMLFGETDGLPVFERLLKGQGKDVGVLTGMAAFPKELSLKQMHFVMDEDFYSVKGIGFLLKNYIKFAVGVPFTQSFARDAALSSLDEIEDPGNAIEVDGEIYYATTYKESIQEWRVYLHVYYDEKRHVRERESFMRDIVEMEEELVSGKRSKDDEKVRKYFSFLKTSDGYLGLQRREAVIYEQTRLAGYLTILTNDEKDPAYILKAYRTRTAAQKTFDNIKNDLDLERLHIHSDVEMEGRVFISFLSLIITSYIRKVLEEQKLSDLYSLEGLYAELKKLRLIEFNNGERRLTEATDDHEAIFKAFGLTLPEPMAL